MKLDGRFWLTKDGKSFLGQGRVELLKTIDRTGSIHKAAKDMKMSYKAAWDRMNSMNSLADEPLIIKTIGGKSGGGSVLTPYAYKLIETFDKLKELHRDFMNYFEEVESSIEYLNILNKTLFTTSVRNQLKSKIESINSNGVISTINLSLDNNIKLQSTITTQSINNMNLKEQDKVFALIKSSDIKILLNKKSSLKEDENILEGTIVSIKISQDFVEVVLNISSDLLLVATLPIEEAKILKIGDIAFASVNKSSIIIGI